MVVVRNNKKANRKNTQKRSAPRRPLRQPATQPMPRIASRAPLRHQAPAGDMDLSPQQIARLRALLAEETQDQEQEEEEDQPRLLGGRRAYAQQEEAEEEEEDEEEDTSGGGPTGRGLGRGMGRLPKEYDFETLIQELPEFDPNGRNKYATVPPNLRLSLAALGVTIQNLEPEAQELLAEVWEQTISGEE